MMFITRTLLVCSLIGGICIASPASAAPQAPYLQVVAETEVSILCDLTGFDAVNKDLNYLSLVEQVSNQFTYVAKNDLKNPTPINLNTHFRGEIVRLETGDGRNAFLKVVLRHVWAKPDERLGYMCNVTYGSGIYRNYWASEAIIFRPSSLAGKDTTIEKPGVKVTFHQNLLFECTTESTTASTLSIQRIHSFENATNICDFNNTHCSNSTDDWLQVRVFNASCSYEGLYRCVYESNKSPVVSVMLPGCLRERTTTIPPMTTEHTTHSDVMTEQSTSPCVTTAPTMPTDRGDNTVVWIFIVLFIVFLVLFLLLLVYILLLIRLNRNNEDMKYLPFISCRNCLGRNSQQRIESGDVSLHERQSLINNQDRAGSNHNNLSSNLQDPSDTPTANSNPQDTTDSPQNPSSNPQDTTDSPQNLSSNPQDTTDRPQNPSNTSQDTTDSLQNPGSNPQDTTDSPQNRSSNPQDITDSPQNRSSNPQDIADSPQNPSSNPQDTTDSPQNPSSNPQDIADSPQNPSSNPQDTTDSPQNPSSNPQNITDSPQNPSSNPQDTTDSPQNPSSNPQDITDSPHVLSGAPHDSSGIHHDHSSTLQYATDSPQNPSGTPQETSITLSDPSNTSQDPSRTSHDPCDPQDSSGTLHEENDIPHDPNGTHHDASNTTLDHVSTNHYPSNNAHDPSSTSQNPSITPHADAFGEPSGNAGRDRYDLPNSKEKVECSKDQGNEKESSNLLSHAAFDIDIHSHSKQSQSLVNKIYAESTQMNKTPDSL